MTLSSSSGDDHMKADKVRQSKVGSSDIYEHACRAVVGSQFRSNNNTDKIKIYIESSSLFHFLRHHILRHDNLSGRFRFRTSGAFGGRRGHCWVHLANGVWDARRRVSYLFLASNCRKAKKSQTRKFRRPVS